MRALNTLIYRVLQIAITVLIAVMLIPVTLQIFSRLFEFIPRYIWTEEVARLGRMRLIMPAARAGGRHAPPRTLQPGWGGRPVGAGDAAEGAGGRGAGGEHAESCDALA